MKFEARLTIEKQQALTPQSNDESKDRLCRLLEKYYIIEKLYSMVW